VEKKRDENKINEVAALSGAYMCPDNLKLQILTSGYA
jgi:hypothetical protein